MYSILVSAARHPTTSDFGTDFLTHGPAPSRNILAPAYPDEEKSEIKRFNEYLGGKKRFSEYLGGKRSVKRLSVFLGGKKRFSEFPGGKKRLSEYPNQEKRLSTFLGGKKRSFSEYLGGKRSLSFWTSFLFSRRFKHYIPAQIFSMTRLLPD